MGFGSACVSTSADASERGQGADEVEVKAEGVLNSLDDMKEEIKRRDAQVPRPASIYASSASIYAGGNSVDGLGAVVVLGGDPVCVGGDADVSGGVTAKSAGGPPGRAEEAAPGVCV